MVRVTLASLLVLSACAGPRDWVPEDLDVGQKVSELGVAAYGQLCNAFEGYIHTIYGSPLLVQAACTAHALQTTHSADECGRVAEECTATLPHPVEEQLDRILKQASCPSSRDSGESSCDAPVTSLISCLDALDTQVGEIKFGLTCAMFGSPVPKDWWKIQAPPECSDLGESCIKALL